MHHEPEAQSYKHCSNIYMDECKYSIDLNHHTTWGLTTLRFMTTPCIPAIKTWLHFLFVPHFHFSVKVISPQFSKREISSQQHLGYLRDCVLLMGTISSMYTHSNKDSLIWVLQLLCNCLIIRGRGLTLTFRCQQERNQAENERKDSFILSLMLSVC